MSDKTSDKTSDNEPKRTSCTKGKKHTEATKAKIREAALRRDKPNRLTHGYSANYPRLFGIWETMRGRCENPNRAKYKDYGGRGIQVCEEWHDAAKFCEWALENGYKEGLQIDRIDNNGNYEPLNCRWVTPKENSRNRRNTVYLSVKGETKSAAEWAEITCISSYTIYWWVKKKGKEYAEQRIGEKIA